MKPAAAPPGALRLACAQRKVRSFLAQVSALEASDFAHSDAEEALAVVKARFRRHSETLQSLSPSSRGVGNVCQEVITDSEKHTSILGIILRSSNVRNPFEVYYPLKAIVNKVIPGARLVLSSEWDWSPFTYPLGLLDDFILIGSPAPEADNALITPLAGHEIGHSAWRLHGIAQSLSGVVSSKLSDAIDRVAGTGKQTDDFNQTCFDLTYAQVEEVFCDLVGLYIFAESFIYAYEHVLAPGGLHGSEFYPDALKRVEYLREAANRWKIDYDESALSFWKESDPRPNKLPVIISDLAVEDILPDIIKAVERLMKRQKLERPTKKGTNAVEQSLQARVPYGGRARLSEIICAGWSVVRSEGGLGRDEDKERCNSLNEVMLKTIEVSEFLRRVQHA